MSRELMVLAGTAMLLVCLSCCVASALLQIIAWGQHKRPETPISLRALWKPEGYFDAIGMHQIRLARRLLKVGAVAYLLFGALLLVTPRE
ncbi:MAG: hypothetical protein M3434_07800 [Gemmatimonadota bacterium]|nr:hypothetical protein [Gemmatimonadota bacterium]